MVGLKSAHLAPVVRKEDETVLIGKGTAITLTHIPQSGWRGIGWFRLRLKSDPTLAAQPLALVMVHYGAVEYRLVAGCRTPTFAAVLVLPAPARQSFTLVVFGEMTEVRHWYSHVLIWFPVIEVDAVFDPIGGAHLWHSREALRPGGRVVGYGNTTSLRGKGLGSDRPGRRNRLHGIPIYALYIAGSWLLPGRKRIVPYSIQTLKRLKPALFRQDLITLLDLLKQQKIKPLIAQRFPLAEAKLAQELLENGGVIGKLVLVRNGSSLESGAA